MFVTPEDPGEGISAVKALSKAAQQGQRIYHITPANAATALPNIHIDAAAKNEIIAALNAGKEVTTHTDPISVPGWSGAGYVIFDPVTGDGAYKISGGANGGWLVIAAFVVIAALILFSVLSGNLIAAALLSLQFWKFAKNIKHIAETANSESEAAYELNRLLFLTTVGVVLAVVGPFGRLVTGGAEYSSLVFLSGFISVFSSAWYS